jgi:hypothetical protein
VQIYQRTPTAEEQEALLIGQDVFQMSQCAGWERFSKYLSGLVEEVQSEAFANMSSDPMTHMRHVIRFQQREAMRKAVLAYVHEHVAERNRIIESLQQPEEGDEWQHQQ